MTFAPSCEWAGLKDGRSPLTGVTRALTLIKTLNELKWEPRWSRLPPDERRNKFQLTLRFDAREPSWTDGTY